MYVYACVHTHVNTQPYECEGQGTQPVGIALLASLIGSWGVELKPRDLMATMEPSLEPVGSSDPPALSPTQGTSAWLVEATDVRGV